MRASIRKNNMYRRRAAETARAVALAAAVSLLGACAGWPTTTDAPLEVPAAATEGRECIAQWQPQRLPGKRATRYEVLADAGAPRLRARANRSASLLRHALRVEPSALGTLSFAWRVPALIDGADVRDRDLEDAPVRVLLSFEGDESRLSVRNRMVFDLAHAVAGERPPYATLMYVWDARAPQGSVVVSERTDRVRKIVLESGSQRLGAWHHYERDIAADFERAFGERPGALTGVALMTDADNTGTQATAWYGAVCLGPAPPPAR